MRYIYVCASHSKWKTAEYAVCMCVYMSTFRKTVEVSDSHMQPFVLSFYCSPFPHFLFIFASLIPSKSAMETPYNGNNYRYSIFIYGSEFDLNWLCVCSRNSRRENGAGREGKACVASRACVPIHNWLALPMAPITSHNLQLTNLQRKRKYSRIFSSF